MDKQKVVEIAKNSGFDPHDMSCDFTVNLENILEFAAAILREAAGVCEDQYQKLKNEHLNAASISTVIKDDLYGACVGKWKLEQIAEELTK